MMLGTRPRFLIADDHLFLAELCKKLLDGEFEVVGIVADGRAMVREASRLKPDVVLVDVAMPTLNGLEAGRQVKKILPAIKLLYLSMKSDPEIVAEAFRCGASGYLLKTCTSSQLVIATRMILRGRTYMSPTLPRDKIDYLRRQDPARAQNGRRLTSRQREVLQLLAEGKCMKEVGAVLNMTTRTVAFHKYRMMERLGVTSTADLVRFAVESHIVAA
jgi:DNA-binding NarL/FixJ family response regulator